MLSEQLLKELLWRFDTIEEKPYKFHSEMQEKINSNLIKGFNSYAKTNIIGTIPADIII